MSKSMCNMIGQTPLLELSRFVSKEGIQGRILAKCEFSNPGGSVKDRVALAMIRQAERNGQLAPGGTIIEPTSGNTGIGLAALGSQMGYHVIIVMPDSMSLERRKMMAVFGAEVVLTPGALGMSGAIRKSEELLKAYPNAVIAGQFSNPANPQVHYDTTGPEIGHEIDGVLHAFVAGVGTGGTITGCGRYLKERFPQVQVIAVEPKNSPVLSGGKPGPHALQGIGAGFIPEILDQRIYDEVYCADDMAAAQCCRQLAETEGLFCGISSGAALAGAVDWLGRHPGRTVAVLLPDSGNRYLSSELLFQN